MYSVTNSFGLNGLRGFAVAVEADVSGGLPAFSIVGLPDSAVRESADRVRAAIKNLGFRFPDRRITINLAPADVRKTGPVYDLPLLLALLTASGQLEEVPADTAFLGELALDGSLRPVSGVLPMALAAAEHGIRALYVPAENAAEAAEACADTMTVYPAHTAREVVEALKGIRPLSPAAAIPFDPEDAWQQVPDFAAQKPIVPPISTLMTSMSINFGIALRFAFLISLSSIIFFLLQIENIFYRDAAYLGNRQGKGDRR